MIPVASNDKSHAQQEIDHHLLHRQTRLEMLFHSLAAVQRIALGRPSCLPHTVGLRFFAICARVTQALLTDFTLLASLCSLAILHRRTSSCGSNRLRRIVDRMRRLSRCCNPVPRRNRCFRWWYGSCVVGIRGASLAGSL